MKVAFYNLLFLAIAGIFFSVVAEVFLRIDGRYADLVSENLVRSRAIWDRPANDTQYRKHPDLDYDVEIVFNDFSIRNHHGVTVTDVEAFQGNLIGVFGDSMTENRRIDDEFTFTSILNEFLNPDFMVLNFGVDGYGVDQAYLKYLDFEGRSELSHVFYIFVLNDLRNIYENQIFDFSGNTIGEPTAPGINPFVEVARKLHVVYLFMDSYARVKAKMATESYSLDSLNEMIQGRFGDDTFKKQRGKRYHDEYADSIVADYLSNSPSESTLEWAKRFRILLEAWRSEVTSSGQHFVIFVVPTQLTTDLARKLFGQQFAAQTVYMIDDFPEGYQNFRFENDNHWNEKGNLRAGQAIADWGVANKMWPQDKEKWGVLSAKAERAIQRRYQQ